MDQAAPTTTITTAEAEIACISGDEATLSRYLCEAEEPSPDVIQSIAECLLANRPESDLGPGDQMLEFSPRNGRPSRKHPEITSAVLAIAHGQAIPLGLHLQAAAKLDTDTRRALASAFDPDCDAASKWRLKYTHARRGFPRSELKNSLILAEIGHRALQLRDEGKLWHEIYSALPHAETTIKKAVRFVSANRVASGKFRE
jgi:hypothetical protein